MLASSIAALKGAVDEAEAAAPDAAGRFRAAALAFFDFYATRPRDLDLGFYLFQGGMRPHGLGRERDRALNEALEATLAPIRDAVLERLEGMYAFVLIDRVRGVAIAARDPFDCPMVAEYRRA